jgi:hypothetical protein
MNALNADLSGKRVRLKDGRSMTVDSPDGGNGAFSFTTGRGLYGVFDTGERTGKIDAMQVAAVVGERRNEHE